MALEEKEYLFRLRLLYEPGGDLRLAETVHKTVILKDGATLSESGDRVTTVTPSKMSAAAQIALEAFTLALASDEAEAAERRAAEAAAAEAKRAEAENEA